MKDIREVFDEWAVNGRAEGMEQGHGAAARRAFDLLALKRDSRYLDIGCGNGYTVRWAAAACPDGFAVGLDLSEEMIQRARRMSEGIPQAQFVAGSFPDVDLPSAPYDAIFSMEVFYYFSDLDRALLAVRDLLRPGARFACVVDFYGENAAAHGWPEDLGVPMTLLDSSGWADAFRRAGLAVTDQRRLRLSPEEASAEWKVTEGSLLTMGTR